MADGDVLLITGASTGIGAATARMAAERGFRVVLGARSEDKLASLTDELGESAAWRRTDVNDWDDQQALVALAHERFGGLDATFANAGFGAKRGFLEESPEHWRDMVLTNVYGAALTIRAALPHLLERGSGHVLLTSSVAGRRVMPGSLYSATKHAVTAMGDALRQEVYGKGIRVTLIEPGMVDTPFFDERPASGALEPEDIARAVLYALEQPPGVEAGELLVLPVRRAD